MKPLLLLPGPVTVARPVLEAMLQPMINHRGGKFHELLDRVASALQPIFGTGQDIYILGSSGTGAMEAAIVNCCSPGDVVLSCPIGVFGRRFGDIAKTYGCYVETLETPVGAAVDPQTLAARLGADGERRIAAVLLTHNETSTGAQNDMAALAPILQRHGALTLVDSVSGLGAAEFRMDEWGYDVVTTASQKALAVPPGLAMIAMSERARKAAIESRTPRYYFDLTKAREFAHEGQTPWTPPVSIVYALDVALQRYHATGLAANLARHARYARAVRAAFESLGWTLVSKPGAHSVTVVAATPPATVKPAALLERLRERYGVVLSGGQGELAGKIVRFGTMGEVDHDDIVHAIEAIESALADEGVKVERGSGASAARAVLSER
ncbi:MAG TPA: alanine--glyoxylate aminotransferase family protein [Candidatus Tumulicola sp.]